MCVCVCVTVYVYAHIHRTVQRNLDEFGSDNVFELALYRGVEHPFPLLNSFPSATPMASACIPSLRCTQTWRGSVDVEGEGVQV